MATDKLGQEIIVNEWVAYAEYDTLRLGKIIKITPKMVRIEPLNDGQHTLLRYQHDVLVIRSAEVTYWMLST